MNQHENVIEADTKIKDILEICLKDGVVFEVMDAQQNLAGMSLLELLPRAPSDHRSLLFEYTAPVIARFRPLQQGAAEMRADGNYSFSFQYEKSIFSFRGRLLEVDPDRLLFRFCLEDKLYKHQTRRSSRLTIDTPDRISAIIGNKTFQVINISLGGVGILIDEPDLFRIGQELPVKLCSENRELEAGGSVRHVAPLSGKGFICGICLTYHNEKSLKHVKKFIEQALQTRKHLYITNLLAR
ncbi:MAG: PilZ domain-containing protein [Deltaproteobacteria bacterium]|nr:PilZ domain-containing protein [Deltaproteobacteria bacterium]MBW1993803.1 PilZ domain-containing protein [Deltaproteobacteria bacterium]MBW2151978.1 PilZ domain-containing protein [Deltaproteobacteria bacterium]